MKVNIKKLQEKYNERINKIGKKKLSITITPRKGDFHLDIVKMMTEYKKIRERDSKRKEDRKEEKNKNKKGPTCIGPFFYFLRVLIKFTRFQISSESGIFFLKLGISSRPSDIL